MIKIPRRFKYMLFGLLSIVIIVISIDLFYYFISGYHVTAIVIKADKFVNKSCNIDSDCIVVTTSCCNGCGNDYDSCISINKDSQESFNKMKSLQCLGKACSSIPPDNYEFKNPFVVCKDNRCEVDFF